MGLFVITATPVYLFMLFTYLQSGADCLNCPASSPNTVSICKSTSVTVFGGDVFLSGVTDSDDTSSCTCDVSSISVSNTTASIKLVSVGIIHGCQYKLAFGYINTTNLFTYNCQNGSFSNPLSEIQPYTVQWKLLPDVNTSAGFKFCLKFSLQSEFANLAIICNPTGSTIPAVDFTQPNTRVSTGIPTVPPLSVTTKASPITISPSPITTKSSPVTTSPSSITTPSPMTTPSSITTSSSITTLSSITTTSSPLATSPLGTTPTSITTTPSSITTTSSSITTPSSPLATPSSITPPPSSITPPPSSITPPPSSIITPSSITTPPSITTSSSITTTSSPLATSPLGTTPTSITTTPSSITTIPQGRDISRLLTSTSTGITTQTETSSEITNSSSEIKDATSPLQQSVSLSVIIGGSAGGCVLVLVVTIVIYISFWRRRKANMDKRIDTTASESLNDFRNMLIIVENDLYNSMDEVSSQSIDQQYVTDQPTNVELSNQTYYNIEDTQSGSGVGMSDMAYVSGVELPNHTQSNESNDNTTADVEYAVIKKKPKHNSSVIIDSYGYAVVNSQ